MDTPERLVMLSAEQVRIFWSHVQQGDPWECWPWQAYTNRDGYGQWSIRLDGRKVTFYAHRLAYALTCEPIPDNFEAAHSVICDTRACCNPDHLEPKSHWDNMQDIRSRKALALAVAIMPLGL